LLGLIRLLVYARAKPEGAGKVGPIFLREDLLEHVLVHPSYNVRTLALSLIVSSSSTTRPYSPTALALLKRYLGMYFADSEARFRNELLGNLRDMYKRIAGGISVLRRSLGRARAAGAKRSPAAADATKPAFHHTNIIAHSESELAHALELHEDFLRWYIRYLGSELTPTASYQRRITALKALHRIVQLGSAPRKAQAPSEEDSMVFELLDASLATMLLDCLVDPFDDVRDTAATLIRLLYSDERYRRILPHGRTRHGILSTFVTRVNELASQTGRADHANGVARGYELLHRFSEDLDARSELLSDLLRSLRDRIASAEKSLGSAVLDAPTHGLFAALRLDFPGGSIYPDAC
jgi:hypothetical protein